MDLTQEIKHHNDAIQILDKLVEIEKEIINLKETIDKYDKMCVDSLIQRSEVQKLSKEYKLLKQNYEQKYK